MIDLATPEDRDAAAGEYVLGTLNDADRDAYAAALAHDAALVALSDTLSLALCGELAPPLDLEAPDRAGGRRTGRGGGLDGHAARLSLIRLRMEGDSRIRISTMVKTLIALPSPRLRAPSAKATR